MIYTDGVHLMSDKDEKELHEFASGIGMKRSWFQDSVMHPHYDITSNRMLAKAKKAGATVVSSQELVLKCSKLFRDKR